jgi:hypothetical protein
MKNLSENVRALVCACGKVYQLKVKFFVTASSYERAAAKEREGNPATTAIRVCNVQKREKFFLFFSSV